jgi:hypothetical protein
VRELDQCKIYLRRSAGVDLNERISRTLSGSDGGRIFYFPAGAYSWDSLTSSRRLKRDMLYVQIQ